MSGLWRNNEKTPEGKYLVQRRDGSVPEWPYFVIGAKDPAAPAALRAYAEKAEAIGLDPQYVEDIRQLAEHFEDFLLKHGKSDPDAPPHRADDPATIEKMRHGHSA